jgi:glutathione S-transferase
VQLYNSPLSPYVARIRIQIYAKGLDIELVDPPAGGHSSDAYRAINFTGKVPALAVDGVVIPESGAIAEFLEERFPEPSMLPGSDLERARSRVMTEISTSYLFPALGTLFGQMDPEVRDAATLADAVAEFSAKLDWIEHLLCEAGPYALGSQLTLLDRASALRSRSLRAWLAADAGGRPAPPHRLLRRAPVLGAWGEEPGRGPPASGALVGTRARARRRRAGGCGNGGGRGQRVWRLKSVSLGRPHGLRLGPLRTANQTISKRRTADEEMDTDEEAGGQYEGKHGLPSAGPCRAGFAR